MGLSSSTTKTTTGPSKQALPYLTAGSSALQSAYDANQPNTQAIGSTLFNTFQNYNNSLLNNPTMDAAKGYVQDTLGGPYTPNPQLGNIINQTNNDIMDRINGQFSLAGQTGSSRQLGELTKQLANNETNLDYTDYNNWLQRQQAAAGLAPTLQSADNQSALGEATLGTTAAQEPYIGAQILANGLGGLWGNSQTTTQTQSGGLVPSLLGAALGGWATGGFKL